MKVWSWWERRLAVETLNAMAGQEELPSDADDLREVGFQVIQGDG